MTIRQQAERAWTLVPKGRLARGAALVLAVKVMSLPSALLFQWGMVRLLGPEAYGEFIYAITWYLSLLPFATLGLQEATVRFVSEYKEQKAASELRGYLRWATVVGAAGALVVCGGALAVTWALKPRLAPTLASSLVIALLCLPLGTMGMLAAMVLRGLERFVASQAPQQVMQPLLAISLTWLLVSGLGRPAEARTAAWAFLTAVSGFALLSILLARAASRTLLSGADPSYAPGVWTDAAVHFMGLAFLAVLYRVDVLMLGALTNTREAGVYATVVQLHLMAGFGFRILGVVLGPTISRLHAGNDRRRLQEALRLSALASTGIAVGVVALLVLFGRWILALFDPSFVVGYGALVILCGAQVYHVGTGPAGRVLTMTGRHRQAFWLAGGGTLLNVLLNLVLIPPLGMTGAAIALLASITVWKTAGTVYVKRALGIDPSLLAALGKVS